MGMGFFMNFNFVYDVASDRLYFERRHAAPPVDSSTMMEPPGSSSPRVICGVYKVQKGGGPAVEAGLRKDDRIIKLGPLQGRGLNCYSIYELCETTSRRTDAAMSNIHTPNKRKHLTTKLKLSEKKYLFPPQYRREGGPSNRLHPRRVGKTVVRGPDVVEGFAVEDFSL